VALGLGGAPALRELLQYIPLAIVELIQKLSRNKMQNEHQALEEEERDFNQRSLTDTLVDFIQKGSTHPLGTGTAGPSGRRGRGGGVL